MGNAFEEVTGGCRGGSAPFPRQHRPGRFKQDFKIEFQGPVPPAIARHERAGVDVMRIQIHPFFEANII